MDLLATIASTCLEGQTLSKDAVFELIPNDASDPETLYTNLKEQLPKAFPYLENGPRRQGGFRPVAKPPSLRKSDYANKPYEVSDAGLDSDDSKAVERLSEVLGRESLEELVGKGILNALRSYARISEKTDLSFNKTALATMLVVRDGKSLFADKGVREAVQKALNPKQDPPGKWHPGKSTSIRWVTDHQFPLSYAGAKNEGRPPSSEVLKGYQDLPKLADFQEETRDRALSILEKVGRCVVSLPTGAGKTRTAMDLLCKRFMGKSAKTIVLWIAHTVELLEQAIECLAEVWSRTPGLSDVEFYRFYGQYSTECVPLELFEESTQINQIIFSTPVTMAKRLTDWFEAKETSEPAEDWCDSVELIVIDEAHRAAAPMYKSLLQEFEGRSAAVVGLTATPFRKEYLENEDTAVLKELFYGIAEPNNAVGLRELLQNRGVLAKPKEEVIKSNVSLSSGAAAASADMSSEEVEKFDKAMGQQADRPERRSRIFARLLEYAEDPKNRILYFGPSVNDAQIMAFLLRAKKISAGSVSGETSASQRRSLVRDFKAGKIQVLCNCEVLTTGFDAPAVTHVVIGRPTISQVLYEQMVGRGLRGPEFGGTETCLILNVEDNCKFERPKLGYIGWRGVWGLEKLKIGSG